MSHREEGLIFNPEKKEIVGKSADIDKSLEDIIKERRKSKQTDGSKLARRGRRQRNEKRTKTSNDSKKSSRQNKKETKKESKKAPSKKNIDIKVPESFLVEIMENLGVDTKAYSLRLVATKKK